MFAESTIILVAAGVSMETSFDVVGLEGSDYRGRTMPGSGLDKPGCVVFS